MTKGFSFFAFETEVGSLWRQLLSGAIVVVPVGGLIVYGGEAGIGLLYLLSFTVAAGLFAYHYPTATIVFWALLALYGRQMFGTVSIGGAIDVRATDPVLLAMTIAMACAIIMGDERTRRAFMGPCLLWTILIAWLGFQFVRSIPEHGVVSTLGELRFTFQSLFVLPYIVTFIRTKSQQRNLFIALSLLSIVFMVAALAKGGLVHDFAVSRNTRWMAAHANFALVLSMAGWYVMRQAGLLKGSGTYFYSLLFTALVLLVVCNHRSVWMATAGLLCCLAAFRLISGGKFLGLLGGLVVAGVAIDLFTSDVDMVEFLRTRMMAFTAYEEDPTANWRLQVWTAALDQLKASPILGKGLGSYFQVQIEDGRIVTAIPHNVYVQVAVQLGVVGLLLYLWFVVGALRGLWKTYRSASDLQACTISLFAVIALAGGSLFYMAYGFDPFTWLYVGLGMAVALAPGGNSRSASRVPELPLSSKTK